jgi:hypothetical protein
MASASWFRNTCRGFGRHSRDGRHGNADAGKYAADDDRLRPVRADGNGRHVLGGEGTRGLDSNYYGDPRPYRNPNGTVAREYDGAARFRKAWSPSHYREDDVSKQRSFMVFVAALLLGGATEALARAQLVRAVPPAGVRCSRRRVKSRSGLAKDLSPHSAPPSFVTPLVSRSIKVTARSTRAIARSSAFRCPLWSPAFTKSSGRRCRRIRTRSAVTSPSRSANKDFRHPVIVDLFRSAALT